MKPYFPLALATLTGLSACNDDLNLSAASGPAQAVIATSDSSYQTGSHSVISTLSPFAASNSLAAEASGDVVISTAEDHFFRINRFGSNTISRFEADDPATAVWTYSSDSASETNSNPYDLIEVSPNKGYLLRYGSSKLWIVNPAAATEAEFKLGEIDLSAYDTDGIPEMAVALYQAGLLYVGVQRLQNFSATQDSYVVVIDTASDQEVDTRITGSNAPLKGINTGLRNLTEMALVPDDGDLILSASGGYDANFAPALDGGIARLDVASFRVTQLLDDGEPANSSTGQFIQLAIADASRGYLVASPSYGSASVYGFDPSTGVLANNGEAIAGLNDLNLGDIAIDNEQRLWVAQLDPNAPGITIVDTDDQLLEALIDTVQIPRDIGFVR